jgi:autotransporter-associated beta strand protein
MIIRYYPIPFTAFSLFAVISLATISEASDLTKLNNGTALSSAGAWSENIAPDGTQIGVWTSDWDNTSTSVYTGSNLLGIKIKSGAGPVDLMASGNNNFMTLGTGGFTLENGTQLSYSGSNNVTGTIDFAGPQTWSLEAGSLLHFNTSRALFTGDTSENITVNGTGTLSLSFRNDNPHTVSLGSGSLTFTGGQRWINGSSNSKNYNINQILTNKVFVNGDITMQSNNAGTTNTAAILLSGGMDLGANDVAITLTMPNASGQNLNANQVIRLNSANTSTITGSGTVTFLNESSDANKIAGLAVESGGTFGGGLDVVMGANTFLSVVSGNALTSSTNLTLNDGGYLIARQGSNVNATIGTLSGAGAVTYVPSAGTTVFTLTLDGGSTTGTSEFSGKIGSDSSINSSSNAIAVTKTGTNTQILSGTMNYTKATTVSGGTLLVNGTHAQSANGSGYTVASGTALGGTGRIALFIQGVSNATMVTVASGGSIVPGGNGTVGTFTLDSANISGTTITRSLVMNSGSTFSFDVSGNAADRIDLWNFQTGLVAFANNVINIDLAGAVATGTYTVDLFRFYTDAGVTLGLSSITGGLVLGTLDADITSATLSYDSAGGKIQLQYSVVSSAIPEPSSAAALVGVISIICVAGHRRRSSPRQC